MTVSLALVSLGDAAGTPKELQQLPWIHSGLNSICASRLGRVLPALQSLWATGNL